MTLLQNDSFTTNIYISKNKGVYSDRMTEPKRICPCGYVYFVIKDANKTCPQCGRIMRGLI